jgi:hypothetical protein
MQASRKNLAVILVLIMAALWLGASPSWGQATPPAAAPKAPAPAASAAHRYVGPRTPDGKPDLSGIWQAINTAEWDIQAHDAKPGPLVVMGAEGGIPAGLGVVEGGPLPYKPEALEQKKKNEANWLALDPEVKCFLPGLPRATYMPFPFQIVQNSKFVAFTYEFDFASRVVNIGMKNDAPVDSWMGWSKGSWDGDTLVVDVTGMVEDTWFDRAGDFHSGDMHLTERYTPTGPNSLNYEVTVDDPTVYTRPWKMSMPLYRRMDKGIQLLEYNCVPFVEELMLGHLRKVRTPEDIDKDNLPIDNTGGKLAPTTTTE